MYVWQSSTGRWELDYMTGREKSHALVAASHKVTGQWFIMPSYDTRADAEAAMAAIYEEYKS